MSGSFKRKLIVSDVDGTLLNDEGHVTPRTSEAIAQLKDKGHIFTIATGRQYGATRSLLNTIPWLDSYIITTNGASVKHIRTGEVFYNESIDPDIAKQIVNICLSNNSFFRIYSDQEMYAISTEPFIEYLREEMENYPTHLKYTITTGTDPYEMLARGGALKVGLRHMRGEPYGADTLAIKELPGIDMYKSYRSTYDIVKKGISKALGIQRLCEHYGIHPDDTIVFGDEDNDVHMFKFAGVSVAMEVCSDDLKKCASFITGSNNLDGIPKALIRLGLI